MVHPKTCKELENNDFMVLPRFFMPFSMQGIRGFYSNAIGLLNMSTNLRTLQFGIDAVMTSKSIVNKIEIQETIHSQLLLLRRENFSINPLMHYVCKSSDAYSVD